ncbi:MAG TPA: shikimate dehydrogenase [Bacteroidales bacterium]|nr:shikimate dehydrogenase [Bacteroidales bacterium]HOE05636.1 shikimate dehydrogenase [Bacteroidales bacterium]
MENKKEFGLIGYPLGHSYSKTYFTNKFSDLGISHAIYHTFPLTDITKLHNLVKAQKNLVGLNVTTPYKELVIPYLNEHDPLVLRVGTVNVISIFRDGDNYGLKGYNTDVDGLRKLLSGAINRREVSALILGSGGSAKTTAFVLKEMGVPYKFVSRKPGSNDTISYQFLNQRVVSENKLIINATPVGMHPMFHDFPAIPYEGISENHICVDLVYNPPQTQFMKKCAAQGAYTQNGEVMLFEQADKAWDIWQRDVM